ncbi:MAG: acyl-CoA thioesterase II [Flavobacteriaceae bacterium]|nr:acyl-CoA thioesterase II [Flavobacteriaceae bacterium]
MDTIQEVIALLTLEKIDDNTFVGENYETPWGRVFGGQVLGQSLHAAYQTVPEDRFAHSLHAYFILGGQLGIPIQYEVDSIRDGKSFTTRRVVAKQNGVPIFNMSASFHKNEKGVDHQIPMPNLIKPESLDTSRDEIKVLEKFAPKIYNRLKSVLPKVFDIRSVESFLTKYSKNGSPFDNLWFKTSEVLDHKNKAIHHQILAYASDYNLLSTATFPHREELNNKNIFYTSLDHALWFHRDFRIDEWLLYAMDSPSASNSLGFARGSIFNKKGELIASVAQEGLIREQIK